MTVGDLKEKLNEYSDNLTIAMNVKEILSEINIEATFSYEDLFFKVEKYLDNSSLKPHYKLLIFSNEQQSI